MKKNKPRVIVLDDNEYFRAMVAAVLGYDYDVVMGYNGIEGLKLCAKNIPDLVITDIAMPEMDGARFIKELKRRKETAKVPIIILTATHFNTNPSRQFEKDPRVKAILKKPFETDALTKAVREIVPVAGGASPPKK